MSNAVAVAMKIGAAYSQVAIVRDRLSAMVEGNRYTLTKTDVEHLIDLCNETTTNVARAADLLVKE